MSIFTAAAKAAMTTVPKLFTSPWTMRIPKFITDCCRQVSEDRLSISLSIATEKCRSDFRGRKERHFISTYTAMPIPDTYCAMTVARAAPPIPNGSTATNSMSSAMFKTALTARKISGADELPSARSIHEKKL